MIVLIICFCLYSPPHIPLPVLVPLLIIFLTTWPLPSLWDMCLCFKNVLYEEIALQHPASLKVSGGNSCTVFTLFISVNFFFYLTVKLISSYSGFWNLFTPWRKENNNVFLWLEGGTHSDFSLHRASDGTLSGASKSGRQHKIGNNNGKTTNHNALSMAGESN